MAAPVAAAVAAFHAVKLAGLAANLVLFPSLARAGPRPPGRPWPAMSLLVPARDEAHRLPATLPGLCAQDATEILILNDQSTDATAALVRAAAAADPRVRLLDGTPPPRGWTGKNWACHKLAAAAGGDVLVFCDADVRLAPGALAACWRQMCAQHADVFSVFPRQRTGSVGERLLVPLIDEVLLAFLPHPLLRLPAPGAATANGQLLMFRRASYQAVGGHRAVAGDLAEDVALARRARRLGLRLGLALGGGLASTRMYRGYRESVAGFGKNLRAAHGNSDLWLAGTAAWHLLAYSWPWLRWRRGHAWRACALLGLAQRLLVNAKTGRRAPAEALLVPITPLAALPVYALAFRRTAHWKGRSYPAGHNQPPGHRR